MKVVIAEAITNRRSLASTMVRATCIVKLGCWGPVVQCNVGKRGWINGMGGCPNVGGICIGCTMPGFPDKFMPFMNQPPGSLLSSNAVMTYGKAIHALRKFTQASLNKEPAWRRNSGRAVCRSRLQGQQTTSLLLQLQCSWTIMDDATSNLDLGEAQSILQELAAAFPLVNTASVPSISTSLVYSPLPEVDARYQTLVEQIPAVVFMAFLDKGIGEAYVSPQIEEILGYSQEEWLNDPVRWYQQIHPDDKDRWSVEAAGLFLLGNPLKSLYRVMARDGRVVWFHCEAKMVRSQDGRPWFIHGVAFDISELKTAEEALKKSTEQLKILRGV